MRNLWLALVVCLTLSLSAWAQRSTGTIRGAVTDSSGAALVGATAKIRNTATGDVRTVTTNQQGEYIATDLPVGTYEVNLSQPGFKEFVNKGVELHVASTAVVNASLQVGNVQEKVEVEANTIQVETNSGAVGNLVDGNAVRELPLNGRSFAQLTQLMPGVSSAANFDSKHKGLEAGVDFSVNGNSTTGNIFLVDGVNNNDVGSNRTILIYPSIDAISEFKILRNSYGPEYGQAMGAVVNIVTRGGTNSLHGGAFYFGRNDALNATDYFNNLNNAPKDKLRRNDFGYNIGGPIKRDKLFFFWSQEWNREIRGKIRTANVPTDAEKNGDFSVLRGGVDSNNNPCDPAPIDPVSKNPLTQVPTISPAGKLLVSMLPSPNVSNPVNCQNWVASLAAPVFWREENVRVDYNISKTWTLFGRYTQDHWNQPYPSTLGFWGDDIYPSIEGSWQQPGYQATIKLTKIFGSNAVNDFQISYAANKINVTQSGTTPGLNAQIAQAFQPYFPESQKFAGADIGYPVFWGGFGAGSGSSTAASDLWTIGPWHNNQQLYILKDDFSKIVGNHTFKVGFLVSNNQKNELVNASSAENAQFWGVSGGADDANGPTGNGIFNALWAGRQWGFSELQVNPYSQTRWHDFEPYFGDTWKVRRNLTLEYGFRWSLLRNPYSSVDKLASFSPANYNPALGSDPCNGMLIVPGTDFCKSAGFSSGTPGDNRSLKEQNNHAIAPRLGLAWDPWGDGKTSFRMGVGQFFQRERLNNYLQLAANAPFSLNAGGNRTFDAPPAAGSLNAAGAPGYGISTDSDLPNTWQWNVTVEREIARDTKLELAYVGNHGIHLLQFLDGNQVPASQRTAFALQADNANQFRPYGAGQWGFVTFANWTGGSNYHALQALFRTKLVKGLDAQFAYTWSKSLSDTDINNSGNNNQTTLMLDPGNPRLNYGPTQINRPHILTGNIVYTAPRLTNANPFVKGVFGGWELATILDYASGSSMTIYAGRNATNAPNGISGTGANQDNTRPNLVPDQPCRATNGPKYQWLNPQRYTLVGYQIGTFGNAPIGDCLAPGIANTDFSLYKNFRITERLNMQFRMEFFNLFNKVQFLGNSTGFSGINNTVSSSALACTADEIANEPLHPNGTQACVGRPVNTLVWDAGHTRNPNFGAATKDRGPREIQYALKFTF